MHLSDFEVWSDSIQTHYKFTHNTSYFSLLQPILPLHWLNTEVFIRRHQDLYHFYNCTDVKFCLNIWQVKSYCLLFLSSVFCPCFQCIHLRQVAPMVYIKQLKTNMILIWMWLHKTGGWTEITSQLYFILMGDPDIINMTGQVNRWLYWSDITLIRMRSNRIWMFLCTHRATGNCPAWRQHLQLLRKRTRLVICSLCWINRFISQVTSFGVIHDTDVS